MPAINLASKLIIPSVTIPEATLAALVASNYYAVAANGTLINLGASAPTVMTPAAALAAGMVYPQSGGVGGNASVVQNMYQAPLEIRAEYLCAQSGALTTMAGTLSLYNCWSSSAAQSFASSQINTPLTLAATAQAVSQSYQLFGTGTNVTPFPPQFRIVVLQLTALPTGGAGGLCIEFGAF